MRTDTEMASASRADGTKIDLPKNLNVEIPWGENTETSFSAEKLKFVSYTVALKLSDGAN